MARDLFDDAGSLRELYEAVDWSTTPLGPVETWDDTLRSAVDLMLNTRFPVTLLWGPELVLVYNAGYVELIGDKHPAALGARCEDVFPEAWDVIAPMLHSVLGGGPATWLDDQLLPLHRSGFLEESWFTFAYSPVHDLEGRVAGVIDISVEITSRVVARRRLQALAQLNAELGVVQDVADVAPVALRVLDQYPDDLAALDIRTVGSDERRDPRLPAGRGPEGLDDVVVVGSGPGAVVWVPLRASAVEAVLVAALSPMLVVDRDYLDFLRLIATAVSQEIERLSTQEAERTLSAALQESLLSAPPQDAPYDVAVRYRPAAQVAQVGGDWYDVFAVPSGATAIVVGDVAGHDHGAAAVMGQLRNLVRGIAYLGESTPSGLLAGLERAIEGLDVRAVATAVVGELREVPAADGGGAWLRWCNAGHPPPVVVGPDGRAALLDTAADLLIGLDAGIDRVDHERHLEPGTTLVLYTDGLVERRGTDLQVGLAWLVDTVAGCRTDSVDEICDLLLAEVEGHREDDVALLVIRVPG